jgi:hypothetical protein
MSNRRTFHDLKNGVGVLSHNGGPDGGDFDNEKERSELDGRVMEVEMV